MQQRSLHHGFTLVELLVAVALTALIIGFVNQLLNSTTTAVSRGVQFGDIIANNRAISERLFEDGQAMVAPQPATADGNPAGMLVIFGREINRGLTGVYMPVATTSDTKSEKNPDSTPPNLPYAVRSDQLMFIKQNGDPIVETLTPVSDTSFAGKRQHAASYSKLWWGHLQRTPADGSLLTPPTAGANPSALPLDSDNPDGENYAGWGWILGRQELFFTDPTPFPTPLPPEDRPFNVPLVHVDGVYWDSQINAPAGYFLGGPAIAEQKNWGSFSDVSKHPLDAGRRTALTPLALIAETSADGIFFDGMPDTVYRQQAYNMLFPEERLRVNDHPAAPYDAWRIAQMYPYVSQGVSDFIVEFAADANADGIVDFDGDGNYLNGPEPTVTAGTEPRTFWYSSQYPPTYAGVGPSNFTFSNYASAATITGANIQPPTTVGANLPYDPAPAVTNADAAFVWRHDYPDNWPYLIRIRYRVHDTRGEVRTTQDTGLGTFSYTGNDEAQAGRWFEVILPVNREAD